MTSPDQTSLLNIAVEHFRAGRFPQAGQALQELLVIAPAHAPALHLLGLCQYRLGRPLDAADTIRRSLHLDPNNHTFHFNFAEVLRTCGNYSPAASSYARALELAPNYPAARIGLGMIHLLQRDWTAAESDFRSAVALAPNLPDAHARLGDLLRLQNRPEEALDSLQNAIRIDPRHAEAQFNAGLIFYSLGRCDEAIQSFHHAISARPDFAEAHYHLGLACQSIGRDDLAQAHWDKIASLNLTTAAACISAALIRKLQERPAQTVRLLRQALALEPLTPGAHMHLAGALWDQGLLEESLAAYQQGLALHPQDHETRSNYLFALLHHPSPDPRPLAEAHRQWASIHADPLTPLHLHFPNPRDPHRRLRIGYVSADFKQSPIALFLKPILANHDHEQFFIKCYSDVDKPDDWTAQLHPLADEWQNTLPISDAALADHVRRDNIDILIDLSQHAGRHRLLAFARKPAPIQISYLNYPHHAGLSQIDYRLTDIHLDPPGSHSDEPSRLLRLPETYYCYSPPLSSPSLPPLTPLPCNSSGRITFGSFNKLGKLSNPTIELWSRILRAIPQSRLLLNAQGLADPETQTLVSSRFARHGIDPARLILHGWCDLNRYFSLMNAVDIALDTQPFAGGTTTCHLLWNGVPVVTLPGPAALGRIGLSILINIGLPDLIAQNPDQYIHIATDLANNPARLSTLRATLREKMLNSPLMNAPRFTRRLESAYRAAWSRFCAHLPPDNLNIKT